MSIYKILRLCANCVSYNIEIHNTIGKVIRNSLTDPLPCITTLQKTHSLVGRVSKVAESPIFGKRKNIYITKADHLDTEDVRAVRSRKMLIVLAILSRSSSSSIYLDASFLNRVSTWTLTFNPPNIRRNINWNWNLQWL